MDDEHRKWLVGCGLLSLLPLLLVPFCQARSARREIDHATQGEPEVTLPPSVPVVREVTAAERIRTLLSDRRDRSATDGERALGLCQERLAATDLAATERDELLRLLPQAYLAAHREALARGNRAEAIRLVRDVQDHASAGSADQAAAWRDPAGLLLRAHADWTRVDLEAALASGVARADSALAAAWDDPYAALPHAMPVVIEHLLARRRAAAGTEDARALLARAAEVAIACTHLGYDDVRDTPLERTLAAEHTFDELAGMGQQHEAAGEPALATAYWMALKRHGDWAARAKTFRARWELELPIRRAMLALARSIEAGRHRWLRPDVQTNCAIMLAQQARALARELDRRGKLMGDLGPFLALATEADQALLDLHLGRLRRLAAAGEPIEHAAEEYLRDGLLDHLQFRAAYAGHDPLEGVPEPLHAELAARGTTPLERWAALSEAVRRGRYRLAGYGATEVERLLWGVRAREAIARNDLAQTRRVLRSAPRELAVPVVAHLLDRIRRARATSDWGGLYSLGGFYVAELGTDAPASVCDELVSCLAAATEAFVQAGQRMKRVFLLSLMADVRKGTAEGARLRELALRLAFEAVADIQSSPEPRHADRELPSGLVGHSVAAVVNACEIPLLLVYDGPERFYVRVDPMRRGCIVLRDGAYQVAVVGAQEDLRPYRGRETYAERYGCVTYYVQRSDQPAPDPAAIRGFFGAWHLMRTPDGGRYRIADAELGLVARDE